MKILWLTEDFIGIRKFLYGESSEDEGMPAQFQPLKFLSKNGHIVDIISIGDRSIKKIKIEKNITSTVIKRYNNNFFLNLGWRDVRINFFVNVFLSLFTALKFIKKNNYDYIYSNWEFQSLVGSIISLVYKIPNIVRLYGSNLYGRTNGNLSLKNKLLHFNRLLPFIVKKELLIITEDGTQAKKIVQKLNINEKRVVCRLNGLDLNPTIIDFSKQYKVLQGKFIVSYIGAIDGWKRTDLFVKSLKAIKNKIKNINYLIVGDGAKMNDIKKYVRDHNLQDHVTFTGRVSQDERAFLQNKSDIYVSLYNYTNLTNTFLESISLGIPCLVIPNGDTKIVAKNKINCLFIDEDNIEKSLIKQIHYLFQNTSYRKKLGAKARDYALKNFLSWDQTNESDFNEIANILNES